MTNRYVFAAVATCALLCPSVAGAQERGAVGVTTGIPASIGIVWHATERIAIRPEFAFNTASRDSDRSNDVESSSVRLAVGALFYTHKWDNVATYVSPRYTFDRGTTTVDSLSNDGETTDRVHGVSGSFGTQVWIGRRFSAFGELGLAYSKTNSKSGDSITESESTGNAFGTRTAVGIVFYF